MNDNTPSVLDSITIYDLLNESLYEGFINQKDIESYFGRDILGSNDYVSEQDYQKLKVDLSDVIRNKGSIKKEASQKVTDIKINPLTNLKDQRGIAYESFIKLYNDVAATEGISELRFHNEIMRSYFNSIKGDKDTKKNHNSNVGRFYHDLKKVVGAGYVDENGNASNKSYIHSRNLQLAVDRYRKNRDIYSISDQDFYNFLASKVPYARDISEGNCEYLVGDYLVFRMAYSEEKHVNISNLGIRQTNNSLIAINNRTDGSKELRYQSRGIILKTAQRTVYILSVAKRENAQSHDDYFYETMCVRTKWDSDEQSRQYIHGLYQGLVGSGKQPFCTRVFILKLPETTAERIKDMRMSIPLKYFHSRILSKFENSNFEGAKEYPKGSNLWNWLRSLYLLEKNILKKVRNTESTDTLDIDRVRPRIINKINAEYNGLRHYYPHEKVVK